MLQRTLCLTLLILACLLPLPCTADNVLTADPANNKVTVGSIATPATLEVLDSIETTTIEADTVIANQFTGGNAAVSHFDAPTYSGYLRLGDVQVVWGFYDSVPSGSIPKTVFPDEDGTTDPVEFIDINYSLQLTPQTSSGLPRFSTIHSKATDGFYGQTFTNTGGRDNTDGWYLAVGRWQ